jgi:hypothetical protein
MAPPQAAAIPHKIVFALRFTVANEQFPAFPLAEGVRLSLPMAPMPLGYS